MKEVLLPMDGISSLITTMSMGLARTNVMSQASIAMFKQSMDLNEAASAKMMESISEAAPSADGCGALMDVRA